MHLEFLGTAGYHPTATRQTNCIWIPDAAPDAAFVLDAGSGFHRLVGRDLPARLHIFLSHAHLDHTCGLTYLLDVLYQRDCRVTLYADAKTIQAVTHGLFNSPLFPLRFAHDIKVLSELQIEVEGVRVSTFELVHPGGSRAFRFDWDDQKSLAYVTDTVGDGSYIDFVHGADLLIHERNFKDGWEEVARRSGHCTSAQVARVAQESGCRTLALTHFNPLDRDDDLEDESLQNLPCKVLYAHDEMNLEF